MRAGTRKSLIAGLDIGTSKVVALVGDVSESGEVQLLGIGSDQSRGLKRGVVVDIENTVKCIRHAVEEAEVMAGQPIRSVYVGVAGGHIRSLNSQGIVAIRDGEVSTGDIERVIDAARAVPISADQKVLHILPQEFIVDDQDGIREPVGMSGVRLEAQVHIVTGAASASQNIIKCVHRCGLDVDDIVLEQLASSQAVLMDDEKDLGVCLVDIGGGTTDIALFGGGAIRHTAVIPIAGAQVTNDIALALRTPIPHAEEIKIQYGCARAGFTSEDETIQVPALGDRPSRRLPRRALAEVVEPRCEELLGLVRDHIRGTGLGEVAGGVVLTGGSARMEGLVEMAEELFDMPVRLGHPNSVTGIGDVIRNPVYATAVGLLTMDHESHNHRPDPETNGLRRIVGRMRGWIHGAH